MSCARLNEVRPRRPEQLSRPNNVCWATKCLNEVRPRRPEQYTENPGVEEVYEQVSMKSGLEGRNNCRPGNTSSTASTVSMKSGLEGRNN